MSSQPGTQHLRMGWLSTVSHQSHLFILHTPLQYFYTSQVFLSVFWYHKCLSYRLEQEYGHLETPFRKCEWKSLSRVRLCNPMDCSPPGSSILQARIQEWVVISFSKGSSELRDQTQLSCIVGGFVTIWATKPGGPLQCGETFLWGPQAPSKTQPVIHLAYSWKESKRTFWSLSLTGKCLGLEV